MRGPGSSPRSGEGRGEGRNPYSGAAAATDRQFRRSRPIAGRARCRDRHGAAGAAIAARRSAGDRPRFEGDDRRSGFLRAEGWDIDILAHRRHGGQILGLCGGYQMLGRTIADPLGIEGRQKKVAGLGLLELDTVLGDKKRLGTPRGSTSRPECRSRATKCISAKRSGRGWSSRCCASRPGRTGRSAPTAGSPAAICTGSSPSDRFRRAFLARLGAEVGAVAYEQLVDTTLDALADHLEHSLDLAGVLAAARPPRLRRGG